MHIKPLALSLSLFLCLCPLPSLAQSTAIPTSTPAQSWSDRAGRVKGLIWIEKRKEKPRRLYHYALFDTKGVLIVDHRLKGYPDLRKFDEAWPKVSRARDWGYAAGSLFMLPLSFDGFRRN